MSDGINSTNVIMEEGIVWYDKGDDGYFIDISKLEKFSGIKLVNHATNYWYQYKL